jgi:hypothetical protein
MLPSATLATPRLVDASKTMPTNEAFAKGRD